MTSGEGTVSGRRQLVEGLRGQGWPIRLSIAAVVVAAMLIMALSVISIGWVAARQSLLDSASNSARDAGLLITEKAHRMLEPAEATLRLLTSTSLVEAKSLDDRLKSLRTLSDVLVANSLISAVYVGYDDGSFMLVRPLDNATIRDRFKSPPRANFLVQSMQAHGGTMHGEYLFYTSDRELLQRRAEPDYQFDPRTRPWYQTAAKSDSTVFTEPYVFFTSQQVGLTLSQSSPDGHAIFGIDMVLDDLAASLVTLRTTPNAQLALVNAKNQVLAYPDMSRVMLKRDNHFDFKSIDELGVPSLVALNKLGAGNGNGSGKVIPYDVGGEEWIGASMPFDVWRSDGLRMLVTAPADDLLGDLKAKAVHLAFLIVGIALFLMPFGWFAGSAIGRSLSRLTSQAQRMNRFDFSPGQLNPTMLREVNSLTAVMDDMGQTIETFLQISQEMATEPKVERMLTNVLQRVVTATRCRGGAVYLWNRETQAMDLAMATGELTLPAPLAMSFAAGVLPEDGKTDVAPDVARTALVLRGRTGNLEGMLMLEHAADRGHSDAAFTEFVHKLSGMLAVSIETRQLIEAQKKLLDAVIRVMADAIDAKSPYTGGHCERVPELASLLIDRMVSDNTGPYADFTMTEDQRHEFHMAAWLHDCGKVTSPEHIIDKATKLETIYNRIHEVRMRFEVLWRDADVAYWQAVAEGGDRTALASARAAQQQQLQDDFAFVARSNVGGEFMADADVTRLKAICTTGWMRHFDKRLGLSSEELRRMGDAGTEPEALPVAEQLLADRPDHVVPWGNNRPPVEKNDPKNRFGFDMVLPAHAQNMGEVYNLSIPRGTLTEEDRFKINDHIVQTLIMLSSLPWPAHLARVPEIAASHHEKLDGKGYPRKLSADRLTLADRVMAISDIFEALTAADRPYKAPKTLTETLRIMAFMAKDKHIDPELYRYFLHSGLWQTFADTYMLPAQIDVVDVAAIERLLPPPAALAQALNVATAA
jgi:HD-GYP domain-containing protein (c-di-GMP phosphodiesterase class II)